MVSIVKRSILTLCRDRGNLFFVALFPSLLVFLLGNLLSNLDGSDETINPITLFVSVETSDPYGLAASEELLRSLGQSAGVKVQRYDAFAAAKRGVDEGAASAAVRFTQPFGVEIYEGEDKFQNRAVESIFKGFARQAAGLRAVAQAAPEALPQSAANAVQGLVQQKEFGYSRTMLDYYAVAMLVMILFMGGGIGGAGDLYDSRRDGTLGRMLVSPKSRAGIYVQEVLGAMPQNLLQIGCVMLSSTLLFGAHYANTAFGNLLLLAMFFTVGLSVNSVFMLVGLFIRVTPSLIIMPFMWGLMFLSGTFSKEIYIEGVTEFSPIWQVQNAAFDLTVFGKTEKTFWVMAISFVVLVLATLLGALLISRKEVLKG